MRLLSHTILLSLLAHILFSDDNQTSQPLLLHCSPLYTSPVIPTVNLTVFYRTFDRTTDCTVRLTVTGEYTGKVVVAEKCDYHQRRGCALRERVE